MMNLMPDIGENGKAARSEPLVLYFNRGNFERGERPWVLMRLFVGPGFRTETEGSKVESFWSKPEAALYASAVCGEQAWATKGYFYPDPSVVTKRILYKCDDTGEWQVTNGLNMMCRMDTMLRMSWETQ